MHVKKFEARTMKEALEMVKVHLGPDAIILSAKDNNRTFGLVGEGSVEITAAVSSATLQKKQFVESRLKETERETFKKAPVKAQKEVIDKMVTSYIEKSQKAAAPAPSRPATSVRYIDIGEDGLAKNSYSGDAASSRNRQSAIRAQQVSPADFTMPEAQVRVPANREINALKAEIESLKSVITHFKEVPQTFAGSFAGAEFGLPYEMSFMFETLRNAGINDTVIGEILLEAKREIDPTKLKNRAILESWVARYILTNTPTAEGKPLKKFQVFVGLPGAGKTSSLVKLASHLLVNGGKRIALVSADTSKVGATEQLRIYAQILNVPFGIIKSAEDWMALDQNSHGIDHILVDFPGMGLRSNDELFALKQILPPQGIQASVHLVINALKRDSDITEMAKRYSTVGFDDAVFTGIDETNQQGQIFNFVHRFKKAIHSFGMGPRIPEDFEMATPERMLDLIFKITNEGKAA
jgi:flagellar biosynthesis protein FlhF